MKISAKVIGEIEHLIDTAYEALEAGDSGSSRRGQKKSQSGSNTNDKSAVKENLEVDMDSLTQNRITKRKATRKQFGELSPAQKAFIYSEILNRKYQD
jgi:hypothetical protein